MILVDRRWRILSIAIVCVFLCELAFFLIFQALASFVSLCESCALNIYCRSKLHPYASNGHKCVQVNIINTRKLMMPSPQLAPHWSASSNACTREAWLTSGGFHRFAAIKHGSAIHTIVKQVEVWQLLLRLEAPRLINLHRIMHTFAQWCTLAGDLSASVVVLTISGSLSYLLYCDRSGLSKYEVLYMNFTSKILTICLIGWVSTNRVLTILTLYIVANGAIIRSVTPCCKHKQRNSHRVPRFLFHLFQHHPRARFDSRTSLMTLAHSTGCVESLLVPNICRLSVLLDPVHFFVQGYV